MAKKTAPKISVRVDNLSKLQHQLRTLSSHDVLVGVPADKAFERDDDNKVGAVINNAELAYIHTYGTDVIPPRPFLSEGVESVRDQIDDTLARTGAAVLDGKNVALKGLSACGIIAVNGIRRYMTVPSNFEPLAPATIAARQARGLTRTNPLIDTGQLRASITYVVREKGK